MIFTIILDFIIKLIILLRISLCFFQCFTVEHIAVHGETALTQVSHQNA